MAFPNEQSDNIFHRRLAMKMFAKVTAFLVTLVVPCVCKYFCSFNCNKFRLGAFSSKGFGMRGGISVIILVRCLYYML